MTDTLTTTAPTTGLPETPLTVHGLQRAVARVLPHRAGREDHLPVLEGLLIDFRDGELFVVATDRYTLAIARCTTDAPAGAPSWRWLLGAYGADDLAQIMAASDSAEPVELVADWDEDGPVLSVNTRHQHAYCDEVGEPPGLRLPDWREVASGLVQDITPSATDNPERKALASRFLTRWAHLDAPLSLWPTATGDYLVLTAEDFLGLQALTRDCAGPPPSTWLPRLTPPAGRTGDA